MNKSTTILCQALITGCLSALSVFAPPTSWAQSDDRAAADEARAAQEEAEAKQSRMQRMPVPHEAALKLAESEIRDLFKSEYAQRDPEALSILARKLLDRAAESRDHPPTHYVLLRDARDLAARAGDAGTARRAMRLIDRYFTVDMLEMRLQVVSELGRNVQNDWAITVFAKTCLDLADDAMAADRYDDLLKVLTQVEPVTRKAKDIVVVLHLEELKSRLRKLQAEYRRLSVPQRKLADDPSDPTANLLVGKFYSFVKGDWETGLPMLSRGSDEALAKLAQQDLDVKGEKDWPAMAEAWAAASQVERAADAKAAMALRSLHWTIQTAQKQSGLERDKTLQQADELASVAGVPLGVLLLDETDRKNVVQFRKKWFLASDQWYNWTRAQGWCEERRGTLACVANDDEMQVLVALMKPIIQDSGFWLGGTDAGSEGRWRWVDGSSFRYTNWGRRQPDNNGDQEDALEWTQWGWRDINPGAHRPFVVQWTVK